MSELISRSLCSVVWCTVLSIVLICGCSRQFAEIASPSSDNEAPRESREEQPPTGHPLQNGNDLHCETSGGPRPVPELDVTGDGALRLRFHDAEGNPRDMIGEVVVADSGQATIVRLEVGERLSTAGGEATIDLDHSYFERAFFVWAPDGESTWIDLHLRDDLSAEEKAVSIGSEDKSEADSESVSDELPGEVYVRADSDVMLEDTASDEPRVKRGDRVVLLAPRDGKRVDSADALTVRGYARTFEANVVMRLVTDEPVFETFTTATSWADAWGWFEQHVRPEDIPMGPFRLEVGEYSAKDGVWQGVSIDLISK